MDVNAANNIALAIGKYFYTNIKHLICEYECALTPVFRMLFFLAAAPKRPCDIRSRGWIYTLNNPLEHEYDTFRPGEYGQHQLEEGEKGTPHLQGFCYFSQPKTFATMKKIHPRAHWMVMNGTIDENLVYTSKETGRIKPPVSWGEKPRQGKRSDLHDAADILRSTGGPVHKKLRAVAEANPAAFIKYHRGFAALAAITAEVEPEGKPAVWREWQQWLLEYLQRPADDRHILWVYDPSGGKGKSTLVRYLTTNHPDDYASLKGKVADMAYAYNSEGVVFFDVPRTQLEHMDHLYAFAEELKNGSVFSTKYESRRKVFKSPHVVFFANAMPSVGKWSNDRVILVNLEPFTPETIPVPPFHPPALPHTDTDSDSDDASDDESVYNAETQREFHFGG